MGSIRPPGVGAFRPQKSPSWTVETPGLAISEEFLRLA